MKPCSICTCNRMVLGRWCVSHRKRVLDRMRIRFRKAYEMEKESQRLLQLAWGVVVG